MISMFGRLLVGSVSVFALVSCGGGGDIAGDSTDFSVSPSDFKRTVAPDSNGGCSRAVGGPVTFTIIGGQAPFRIVNASPHGLSVDKTEVSGKDPKFSVTPSGGCGDPFVITILDYHSRVVTVEVTVEIEEEEEAPATVP